MTRKFAREVDPAADAGSESGQLPSIVVMDGLRRIVRALRQADAKSRSRSGIPSAQLFVLRQLAGDRPLSIGDLSHATLTSQSSVSEVVTRLEAGGQIRRTTASGDNRRAEISLTAAGRKTLKVADQPFQERLVSALCNLAYEDQQALAKGMSAWLSEAGISDAPSTMFFEP